MDDAPIIVPLSVWMVGKSRGEVKRFLAGFTCAEQNVEVDQFLHNPVKAMRFSKRNVSATHLVMTPDQQKILAYYTLVCKPISVSADSLSDEIKTELELFCRLNATTNCYEFSAYLIAQLGKNFSLDAAERIPGDALMNGILMHLREMRKNLGGNITFVEYERGNQTLLSFYRRNGFVPFQTDTDSTESHLLDQLFRFLN